MIEPDLSDYFAAGVSADDVPELAPLLGARSIVGTFISLFRGSDAEVLLRLLVLREIGQEADAPRWSPDALRRRFSYLDPVKLETVLKRLREHDLLAYADDGLYYLSDLGRNAVAALSMLLRFAAEEDAELGFLTAQLAGLSATGAITPEALSHLLSKLNDLSWHFEEAIASGSEFRIVTARSRLKANGRWIERGTGILRTLLEDPEVDFEIARVAQRIGLAQSRLARVDAAFQRALNKIETQRVTLGGSGISSSDVAGWLRQQTPARLVELIAGALDVTPAPALLAGGHELLDRAEAALSGEAPGMPGSSELPAAHDTPPMIAPEHEDLRLLEHFGRRLEQIRAPAALHEMVAGGGFAPASYRLSLLALLADGEDASPSEGPIGGFMRLPLQVAFTDQLIEVFDDEIARMTVGEVRPLANDTTLGAAIATASATTPSAET